MDMDGLSGRASGTGNTADNREPCVSPGSQGVWFAVKNASGGFGGGSVSLEAYFPFSGTWENIKSYTAAGDAVEIVPVGLQLRVAWTGVAANGPAYTLMPVGGY